VFLEKRLLLLPSAERVLLAASLMVLPQIFPAFTFSQNRSMQIMLEEGEQQNLNSNYRAIVPTVHYYISEKSFRSSGIKRDCQFRIS
jgi:hypothetical protein